MFSCSIAPYGPSEEVRNEGSIPVPLTAYSGSELAPEKFTKYGRQESTRANYSLLGPVLCLVLGRGGNVSRLIKALRKCYFFYMANRDTRKAGIYVKELSRAMMWVLDSEKAKADGVSVFNMSMNLGPSTEEYVNSIARKSKIWVWIPNVPSMILFIIAYSIDFIARPLAISHPFSPVRIRKLIRSNNILPAYLVENRYDYKYTLVEAFSDLGKDYPEEWH